MSKLSYSCLIVDDIFMNRILLKEILKSVCPLIYEAENGKNAIEVIRSKKVDMVFMDIEMPVMNGLETTRFIRNQLPFPLNEIPVIAITAYNPEDFFDDYKNAGFNQLLTKPYSFSKIQKVVTDLMM